MKNTTLCYIEKDNAYLMMHRTKKTVDENKDKWIGIGGKFEEGESPEDCLCREVFEETGLILDAYQYRGIVTFVSNEWGSQLMHLFTSDTFHGDMHACDEGELVWVPKDQIDELNLWEGDRIFFGLLKENLPFFSLKLVYQGDVLTEHKIVRYPS